MAGGGGSFFKDQAINQGMQTGQIRLGASKASVASVTGYPMSFCTQSRIKEDGTYEMWDFATKNCASNLSASYVLIFKNDSLIEIRTVHGRQDMQF